ncbi:hypothetical protein Phum_PHUM504290 [Pediculus humanus corporis]|uniref:SAM domain-containing protein n=1 Tax=Pediculus humanus subsp. corporis TaxID=121224 RepID=E0VXT7_PEDHC|nr:uncharacterized protein Phum_PHUM504290 [Pediculus humanus corporis]EEB18193.1 hypothetical protein Phum_PHUM504290 [Pediculus humanus corporis]
MDYSSTSNKIFPENSNYNEENNDEDLFEWQYIELILHGMNMGKYLNNFVNLNMSLTTFLNMTDDDLFNVGINDGNDRKVILDNLKVHKNYGENCHIPESHSQDLRIAKNVLSQLVILNKYAALLKYKWINQKCIEIDDDDDNSYTTQSLRLFSNVSLEQCNNIIDKLQGPDNLIDLVLQVNSMKLPENLSGHFNEKKYKVVYNYKKLIYLCMGISLFAFTAMKSFKLVKVYECAFLM